VPVEVSEEQAACAYAVTVVGKCDLSHHERFGPATKKFGPLNAAVSSGFFRRITLQKDPEESAFSGLKLFPQNATK
jgi:hypothetical protein